MTYPSRSIKVLRVTCTAGETTVLKFSNELKADPKDDVTAEASFVKLKPGGDEGGGDGEG